VTLQYSVAKDEIKEGRELLIANYELRNPRQACFKWNINIFIDKIRFY